MAKLQLRTNVPEIVALQFTTGKEVESSYNGTEILYTLEDGRSWYVHPSVARKVDALSLGKGEPFEVVKVEAPGGKGFHYEVKHVEVAAPQRQSHSQEQTLQAEAWPKKASVPPGSHPRQNGTTAQVVVHTNASQDTPAPAPTPVTQRMMAALCASIEAVSEAQEYAQAKGLRITFTGEDVRAIANTLFIQTTKGGC